MRGAIFLRVSRDCLSSFFKHYFTLPDYMIYNRFSKEISFVSSFPYSRHVYIGMNIFKWISFKVTNTMVVHNVQR